MRSNMPAASARSRARPSSPFAGALEADRAGVADLGALNRWPERTGVPLEDYLDRWSASCRERGATGRLPAWLRGAFGLG
jgi:hypothetical protein